MQINEDLYTTRWFLFLAPQLKPVFSENLPRKGWHLLFLFPFHFYRFLDAFSLKNFRVNCNDSKICKSTLFKSSWFFRLLTDELFHQLRFSDEYLKNYGNFFFPKYLMAFTSDQSSWWNNSIKNISLFEAVSLFHQHL